VTQLRCGGDFSNHFTTSLLMKLTENIENWLRFDRVTAMHLVSLLFGTLHTISCLRVRCVDGYIVTDIYC